jgi:DNA-binding NtrC family response regulator
MPAASFVRFQFGFPLLFVSSDEQDHSSLEQILRPDCQLHRAAGRREALACIRRFRPWVVVCEQILADGDSRGLLSDIQSEQQMPPSIVSSRLADDRLWAEVLNLGGYDLLTKPFAAAEVSGP